MRIIVIILLFFFTCGYGYSQNLTIPSFETSATTLDDYQTLLKILNKYEFSISEIVYGGWVGWPHHEREYGVIAYEKGKWYKFYLYQPFALKNGQETLGKPHCKFLPASDSVSKKIFDKMIELQLLSMNEDSLNNNDKIIDGKDEGMTVVDGSSYTFLIMIPGHFRIVTADNPDGYYEWNPSVLQRKRFIDFRDAFEKYWQK